MSSEWQNATMRDVVIHYRGGEAFGKLEYASSGIPVIAKGDVKQYGKVSGSFSRFITEERWQEKKYKKTEKGDFVLTTRDLTQAANFLGLLAPVPEPYDFLVNQGANVVKFNHSVDPAYLVYWSHFSQYREHIKNSAVGSTQVHLRKEDFLSAPLVLPPLKEQKAIAHILGTLDDKIELNRKTNETLEAMAKALFKSWFVDFDPVKAKADGRPTGLPAEISELFPDSFEDSELGEIPSGWQRCPFTQLVDVISGGTPKTSIYEYWNGSIPWFSVVDAPSVSDCWVIQTEKSITHLGLDNCSSKLLPTGTTIISARGTVGKVCLTGQDMAMNQSCYGLRSKVENGEYFCFYLTKSLVEILEARAHGSVFSTITRDTLDGVSTISPPPGVIQSFNEIAGALLGKIKNNLEDNRIMGIQRDALLPKLISGEIRIPDAEKMLEEVGV
jgi:type I restriction enzyme S subunit